LGVKRIGAISRGSQANHYRLQKKKKICGLSEMGGGEKIEVSRLSILTRGGKYSKKAEEVWWAN